MKYLLVGDEYKTLYVEDDQQLHSIVYNPIDDIWLPGKNELWSFRVGFDSSEPEDSIYRYGNTDCMKEIKEITKEEAEAFISKKIDEKEIRRMLRFLKRTELYD